MSKVIDQRRRNIQSLRQPLCSLNRPVTFIFLRWLSLRMCASCNYSFYLALCALNLSFTPSSYIKKAHSNGIQRRILKHSTIRLPSLLRPCSAFHSSIPYVDRSPRHSSFHLKDMDHGALRAGRCLYDHVPTSSASHLTKCKLRRRVTRSGHIRRLRRQCGHSCLLLFRSTFRCWHLPLWLRRYI